MKAKLPRSAGGWGALLYSLKQSRRAGGLWPLMRALMSKNSCKSCALGMGGQSGGMRNERGHFPEVCNKSIVAQASDMQGILPVNFFLEHDVDTLSRWTPRELENSGRLVQPVLCEAGDTHYRAVSWQEALQRVAERLQTTTADRTFFYASGRSSNEAGFLLQLFARLYGTNNVNNCSYYCHQASGVGLTQSLGTGTATVRLEDLDATDLMFLIGANPPSNHPRFMRTLMEIRRRGGKVIVINPARERGLENFSVPSDVRSLLFGSDIASTFLQPHIGGDIPLLKGIAKALFEIAGNEPNVLATDFILQFTDDYAAFKEDLDGCKWQELVEASGIAHDAILDAARQYAAAKNVVFAWAMGITHHAHGVENVESIVNLALLRGMVGRKDAGLLPLRGHSNVQGIGSVGVTPQLKQAVFDNLESNYDMTLPTGKGLDTLGCMEAAQAGQFDFAWNLGGNLYGSNPDSAFAKAALENIDFILYMNTTLNQGHFNGRGQTTLILPVLARDEEPEPTTQESMFNFVRVSEGGPPRYLGPRSEVGVIAAIAEKVLEPEPIDWSELGKTGNVRQMIGKVLPGFEKIADIDKTGEEFHIAGRTLHTPQFPTASGKARFTVCAVPDMAHGQPQGNGNRFRLMTVRSEGQFNTVVYDLDDKYRGIPTRNAVLMSREDMQAQGLNEGDTLRVESETGRMQGLTLFPFPIKPGNIMMYYPEANVLVPRSHDAQSKTPSFKSINVTVERE